MKKRNVIALVVLNHLAQATVKNSHMFMRLSQKT